jgi:uncharacterized protein (DUF2236 family)
MGWKVNRESVVLLGGSRAVSMQLAHPLVAMGVSAHSDYMVDPFGRAKRTFVLGEILTFGSYEKARQAARFINRKHFFVHGELSADAGVFSQGTRFDARDPELLLWVHATLIDTWLLCYKLLIGSLKSRQLVQQLLLPPVHSISRPLLHLNLQITNALLPQPIREIYGIEWNTRRQAIFDLSARGMRTIIPRLPLYLRELPITRHLMRETTIYSNKQVQVK